MFYDSILKLKTLYNIGEQLILKVVSISYRLFMIRLVWS